MQKRALYNTFLLIVAGLVRNASADPRSISIGEPATTAIARDAQTGRSERRVTVNAAVSYKKCPRGDESPATASAEFEREILRLVNKERRKAGKPPLALDSDLTRSARYHANDMVIDDYFDHESMDRENGQIVFACKTFERIRKFSKRGYAENIAVGQTSPADVMGSWMRSPGHKQNILSDAKILGVGLAKRPDGYLYWVQNFGY